MSKIGTLFRSLALGTVSAFVLASSAVANQWYFEADLEGGASYLAFTNETGQISLSPHGDELRVSMSDDANDFGPGGSCTQFNCEISVWIDGQSPGSDQDVSMVFSSGKTFEVKARDEQTLISNGDGSAVETTNAIIANVRASEWVEVWFGGKTHRFSLIGSSDALNRVQRKRNLDPTFR